MVLKVRTGNVQDEPGIFLLQSKEAIPADYYNSREPEAKLKRLLLATDGIVSSLIRIISAIGLK